MTTHARVEKRHRVAVSHALHRFDMIAKCTKLDPRQELELHGILAKTVSDTDAAAVERCCAAVCDYCANSKPMWSLTDRRFNHPVSLDGYSDLWVSCKADAIWRAVAEGGGWVMRCTVCAVELDSAMKCANGCVPFPMSQTNAAAVAYDQPRESIEFLRTQLAAANKAAKEWQDSYRELDECDARLTERVKAAEAPAEQAEAALKELNGDYEESESDADYWQDNFVTSDRLNHELEARIGTLTDQLQTARLALEQWAGMWHVIQPLLGGLEEDFTTVHTATHKALATITATEPAGLDDYKANGTPRLDTFERGEKRGFG